MINIYEICPALKVSGLTSLVVQSEYNADLVNAIKALPMSYFHKKLNLWEVPITSLAALLDAVTFIDDIRLELQPDTISRPKIRSDEELNIKEALNLAECKYGPADMTEAEVTNFKLKPFKHQAIAINYGLNTKRWLLLDDMGLGKTASIILMADTLHQRGLIDHCFIICGVNSVKSNWKSEIQKFSNLPCTILGEYVTKRGTHKIGSVHERAESLKKPIEEFFIITNIETLRSDEVIEAFNSKKNPNKIGMIAVDEIHRCSNKSSDQGGNLLKLSAEYMVCATGTLLTSNPVNAYLPLHLIDQDKSTLTGFKAEYCQFGGFNNAQIIGYKNLELLKEELDNCSIRRLKSQIKGLPEKSLFVEYVDMSDAHRKLYEAIKDGIKEEVDKIELNSNNLLALTTRLRQATACPGVLTSQPPMSSKVQRCVEMAMDLVDSGEKVVIMSSFKEPVYQIADLLASYDPLVCTGDSSQAEVDTNKELFQHDPSKKIIVCTHDKMGTGLTLNAAQYMICLDEKWTYAQNSQSHDRIHRVDNDRPAFIYTLICKDTIDERVHEVAEYKKDLSEYIVDDVNNYISESMKAKMRDILLNL